MSIVTPSYNQGQFIEETLRSVKQQTYPYIEHIIVDGRSTDNTLDVLRTYDGTYNMRWISEPDGGMYEAINKGLRMSRGDVLAYLNTDDRYLPWTVSVVMHTLQEHPDVDLVFGDMLSHDEKTGAMSLYLFPPFRLGYIRRRGFLAQPTVFWRKSVLERFGGFDDSLQFIADCDYWMRIGSTCRIRKIHEVLAIQREHPAAKRLAAQELLAKELSRVRSRYVRQTGFLYQLQIIWDCLWCFSWRRCLLIGFLWQKLRAGTAREYQTDGAWSHITTSKHVQVSWTCALRRFILLTEFLRGWKRRVRQWLAAG